MHEDRDSLPSAFDLVEAFVQPPHIVPLAVRESNGATIVVLTAVELWPWRTVLRGVVANSEFVPRRRTLPVVPPDAPPGTISGMIRTVADPAGHRVHAEWMASFALHDDSGTEFRLIGWSGGGPLDQQLWADVEWNFDAPVPASATRLMISGPIIGECEVAVRR